jgi:hypothetical protein
MHDTSFLSVCFITAEGCKSDKFFTVHNSTRLLGITNNFGICNDILSLNLINTENSLNSFEKAKHQKLFLF